MENEKNELKIRIATHDGIFHADEAMAIAMLKIANGDGFEYEVTRTRDSKILNKDNFDFILDVSGDDCIDNVIGTDSHGENDRTFMHLDHHLPNQMVTIGINDVKASTAMRLAFVLFDEALADAMCEDFLEYLSANDCGQTIDAHDAGISSIVAMLNPAWNEENADEAAAFQNAVDFCYMYLDRFIAKYIAETDAKAIVDKAIAEKETGFINDGEMILIEQPDVPWKKALFDNPDGDKVLFVIGKHKTGKWNLIAVPKEPDSFETKVKVPESWWGKRGAELSEKVTDSAIISHVKFFGTVDCKTHYEFNGNIKKLRELYGETATKNLTIDDAIFCHATGFMTRFETRQSTVRAAIIAIDLNKESSNAEK